MEATLSKHIIPGIILFNYLTLLIISVIFYLKPPKAQNDIYGYRTKRTLNSKTLWDFANKIAPVAMLVSCQIMLILSLLVWYFKSYFSSSVSLLIIGVFLPIFCVILVVVYVEKKLKAFEQKKLS